MLKRWPRIRFSSRTFLISFCALAIALAYVATLLRPFHEYNRRFRAVFHTHGVAASFTELNCPLFLRYVLPKGYYTRLTDIYFHAPNHDNATLEALRPHIKALAELRRIDFLEDCNVSDNGLASLSQLSNIKTLRLNGPKFTDAGLEHIGKIKGLQKLVLVGTDISHAGINQLHEHLPKCQVINNSVIAQVAK